MSGTNVIRLDDCALTDLDGVSLSTLIEAIIRRDNCSVEQAVDAALIAVQIDLSRRVYAARQGV